MYFIIVGLPLAVFFAAAQLYLCRKAKSSAAKLLPVFAGAGALILAAFIRGENFLASAVYGIFGQGIFALVVFLWIIGGVLGIGAAAGWIIYLTKK